MDVSIIVVSYNTAGVIKDCLRSVIEKTRGVSYEIIVVDNASSDSSVEMIRSEFPEVRLIENSSNGGFGVANNIGIREAEGDFILFLNPDTVLLNDVASIFHEFFTTENRKNNIGAAGSLLVDQNRKYIHSFYPFPSIFYELLIRYGTLFFKMFRIKWSVKNKSNLKTYSSFFRSFFRLDEEFTVEDSLMPDRVDKIYPMDVHYVTGAVMFVPRYVLDDIGVFDEDFFLYYEETDMQYRMREADLRRVVLHEPAVVHLESHTSNGNHEKRQIIQKSRLLFYRKNYSLFRYLVYKVFYSFSIIIEAGVDLYAKEYTVKENREFLKGFVLES